ncbi:MaoC family dehydratase N-terminal domain-containing protein [Planotetraspora sp. A-T 1434]|uniref:MaoC family dehydratase N-terminal domain-containing protein n=1 Tax=Planotetraspora sp. A-T 1434 TaxID=2979219 RepID=UPI0021C0CCD4|nr:MaoC family dehydratase N-terminal domain-containing protein [Planotetraspora sp. A-T 1434]MCT9930521.1 MaoC family dehydratase N-terminal domain-containing protein [Planotetraspora sp. A-T 1434]
MALNLSCVGKLYPPSEPYEVSREKIKEFAQALRDGHAAYLDPEAARALGYPDVIAPPSFPMVVTLDAEYRAVLDPELGADGQDRFVHREQRFAYERPIHAGDVITVTVRLAAVERLTRGDVVSYESRVTGRGGDHICTGRSIFVVFEEGS